MALLTRPERGAQSLVDARRESRSAGLPVQDDRALERVQYRPGLLAVLDVQHELDFELLTQVTVEVLREILDELLAVVYVWHRISCPFARLPLAVAGRPW